MSSRVYYNEIDEFCAAWLRELMKAGQIPDGEVDTRSIADVQPGDLRGFHQCHFFAGIGGWAYALRLAGWPDEREVWTGSCPCQPFSAAGQGLGENDPRDLWPSWFRLISQRRPVLCFGEQVADAARNGWFDRLCADMEAANYAIGSCVLGAHSAGAPHIRQRLYFLADASGDGLEEQLLSAERRSLVAYVAGGCGLCQDAYLADSSFLSERESPEAPHAITATGETWIVPSCGSESLADADSEQAIGASVARPQCHPWSVEPAVGRVAHGIPHKLVEPFLRGYGNAIVPQVAQVFIEAYLDCCS